MEKTIQIQQGDVCLKSVAKLPKDCEVLHNGKGAILAEGEVTGHMHKVSGGAQLFRASDGQFYMVADADTQVVHEEHNPVSIPGNIVFQVNIVQERDHFERVNRKVVD